MVAADATVRATHNRQTASRHRVIDANALSSRDSRLATRQLRGAATAGAAADRDSDTGRQAGRRSPSETLFREGGA
eukprot:564397-Prymnesium_polylepis.1